MDWKTLIRDRRAQAGIAVAAVAGVYTLAKRRGASGGGSSSGTAGTAGFNGGSSGGGVGGYNSTPTDVAQQLGDYQTGQQQILDDFANRLDTTLARLTLPSAPAPSGQDIAGTSPVLAPVVAPVTAAPVTAPTTVGSPVTTVLTPAATGGAGTIDRPTIGGAVQKLLTVNKAGENWNDVAKQSGLTLNQLRALNPGGLNSLKLNQKVRIG